MPKLRKCLSICFLSLMLLAFSLGTNSGAFAATSILPEAGEESVCGQYDGDPKEPGQMEEDVKNGTITDPIGLIGCAIQSGDTKFWMLPYIVGYALEFVVGIMGLLVILLILIGAYYYIAGGVTDDKEKGKKIITYAIGGYALMLCAWIIVNILLLALTQ